MSHLPSSSARPSHRWRRIAFRVALFLVIYLVVAYLLIPFAWERYARRHASFDDNPRVTVTGDGHPGDPLNVGLAGTEVEVKQAMRAAKWYAADPLGLKSDFEIGADTVLNRSYDEAPVSSLFLFGRREDLAFEQPVGDNPRHRHHVRFWHSGQAAADGRPLWIGSASYDKRVGLSHTTGQITHHIDANVDVERDHVLATLQQTDALTETYKVRGFHQERSGRNGGGDLWTTDGDLWVGVLAAH